MKTKMYCDYSQSFNKVKRIPTAKPEKVSSFFSDLITNLDEQIEQDKVESLEKHHNVILSRNKFRKENLLKNKKRDIYE